MKITKKQALEKFELLKNNFPMEIERDKIKRFAIEFDNHYQIIHCTKTQAFCFQYDPIFETSNEKSAELFMGKLLQEEKRSLEGSRNKIKTNGCMTHLRLRCDSPNYYIFDDADPDYFWIIPIKYCIKAKEMPDLPDIDDKSVFQDYVKRIEFHFYINIQYDPIIYLVSKSSDDFLIFDRHISKKNTEYFNVSTASTVFLNKNNNIFLLTPALKISELLFLNNDFSYNYKGDVINTSDISFILAKKIYSAVNKIVFKRISPFVGKVDEGDWEEQIKKFFKQRIKLSTENYLTIKTDINDSFVYVNKYLNTKLNCMRYFLLPNKDIFILSFIVIANVKDNKVKEICVKYSNSCLISRTDCKLFDYTGSHFPYFGVFNNLSVMNTKKEIKDIINSSNFALCGVFDVWNLNSKNTSYLSLNDDNYLVKFGKAPAIEQLTKILGYSTASKLIRNLFQYNININGKDFYSITGITNYCYRTGKEYGFDYDKIYLLQKMMDEVKNADIKRCCKYVKKITINFFESVMNYCGENPDASYFYENIEYFIKCKREQRINESEILNIYRDYIEMASKLKLNLKDKSIRFPLSLIKEHDITVKNYNLIKKEFEKEKFQELRQSFLSYEYFDENIDGYRIVAPKTPEEIIMEGKNLHHCVASYVERVIKGKSIILFLRKNNNPDVPLYTIEVDPFSKKVVQVRGYGNTSICEADVKKFFHEWEDKISKIAVSA